MIIYHIIDESENVDLTNPYYHPKSLQSDKFIHFSLQSQVSKVANNLFADENIVYLLVIDSEKLEIKDALIMEDLYNLNEDYPHYYGPLNTSAIVSIVPLYKESGLFNFK